MQTIPPVTEAHPRSRSFAERIFISPSENRLRAGWRLLAQFIMMSFLGFFLSLIIGVILVSRQETVTPTSLLLQLATLLAITISVFLCRRLLDHRSITSLGLKLDSLLFIDLVVGIFISALMMSLTFVIQWALGLLTFQGFTWQSLPSTAIVQGLFNALILFIIVSWQEELFSRGYQLQNIADGLNIPWGVILSSLIFAVMHLGNPNVFTSADSALRVILGLVLAGIFLAYGCLRTKQLWLPIGLHIGWNFFEGPVFGFQVSGMEVFRLVEQTVDGPPAITGGTFGPEAGLIILPAFILGFASVYIYSRLVHKSSRGERAFLTIENRKS